MLKLFIIYICIVNYLRAFEISESFDSIKIDTTSRRFIDQYKRERIFHGVNAVYKIAPWIPTSNKFDPLNSLSVEDADILVSWGFNVVRLGVMWPGLEPGLRGQYSVG